MNKTAYLLLIVLFFSIVSFAQTPENFEKHADSVFKVWDNPNKPGAAIGLIKDGKIIYLKGFGAANLETNESINLQTKFQLGAMSKQFTTLAILLLEEQGKLNMNDDIRKYLPELNAYTSPITISHLVNHSSGLYDINRVSNMINGSANITTQAEALKLIASQKTLAFMPGTDFSFHESVTESVLMAEIVSKSSGQSFADFVKTNIFEPMGMKNSQIRDDSKAILSNVALPYQKEEGKDYKTHGVQSNIVGAINAYVSAEDLANWYLNFQNPKGNLDKMVQKLNTPVQLSNGDTFNYYWGEMAVGREFKHPERGLPKFWNFGLEGAYGSNIFRFPEQNIISFTIGNNNQYNGGLAMTVLDPFVKDLFPLPPVIDFKALNIKKLSAKKLKAYEGHYWFKEGYASELFVENDTLRSKYMFSTRHQTLVPLSDNTFQQYAEMEDARIFKFKKEGATTKLFFTYNDGKPDIMERYVPVNPSVKALQAYTGVYYNEEYGSLFSFHIEEGQLVAKNLNHQDIKFKPVIKDVFTSTSMFFNAVNFIKDESNEIKGFKINTDGVPHLEFIKAK